MRIVSIEKNSCCGCGACANVCPSKAILMVKDNGGFYYPEIDESKCIKCDLCKKVCDFSKFEKKQVIHDVNSYAVRHKIDEEVQTSRSGAFFSALANYIIAQKGVCYGAILNDQVRVEHVRAETYEDCKAFKGSKYVQSFISERLFIDCKKDLKNDRFVLFSGTGCQIHGLLSYLKQSRVSVEKLITVDFICHGTPSPGVWEEYLKEFESYYGKKVVFCNFRDKQKFGWTDCVETYHFSDGSTLSEPRWASVFYQHCMFRESCYNCKYTTVARRSDFTIGDYWGFEKVIDGYRDNKGLSFVIAQNKKAEKILSDLADTLNIYPTDLYKSLQPQLEKPVYKGPEYKRFWNLWLQDSRRAIKVFFFPSKQRQLYLAAIKYCKKTIKKALKKLHKR